MFENEILDCTNIDIDFDDKKYALHLRTYVMMDSKLINLATGLGMYLVHVSSKQLIIIILLYDIHSTFLLHNYVIYRWSILLVL